MGTVENALPVDPSAEAGRGGSWFVVLPDCAAAATAVARLPEPARIVRHASGRPLLIGSWAADEVAIGGAGANRIVVVSTGSGVPAGLGAELTDAADWVREVCDLNRLASRLPGSFHLVGSIAGAVRIQGSISGLRRVFFARLGDVAVAADRADVLATAAGTGLAPERLASYLLIPDAPYPLEGEVVWRGVDGLREDNYLLLADDGAAHAVRWWTPPEPVLALAEGANALRAALCAAVDARVQTGRGLSCDLSGGLDSTPVCYLAAAALARRGESLVTVTATSDDPADDDAAWAETAATSMPNLRRLTVAAEQMPLPFGDLLRPGIADDGPSLDAEARGQLEWLAHLLRAHGARLHLTGDGGDELLESDPSYLRDLFWKHPLRAGAQLRGYRALERWSWPAMLRILVDRRSYGGWLAASTDTITAGPATGDVVPDGLGVDYRLPPWATPVAADLLRSRIRGAAAEVEPLGPALWQHQAIEGVRVAGHGIRRTNFLSTQFGLPRAAPYLDDRVIEACLAVRPDERTTPWRYKPLIVEAMRGLLPDAWLRRNTKADGTPVHYAGLRAHRADLLALCEDSELARLGLVDTDQLRIVCNGMWTSPLWPMALSRTIGVERWLRDLRGAGLQTAGAG